MGVAAQPTGPLPTPPMSLPELEAALAAHPPGAERAAERRRIAAAFDALVTVQANDAMTDADRAALAPLADFYRRRVDEGLAALELPPPEQGARIVKFYSSSIVLQSRAGTVAVDFCQGPINNGGEPEERDHRRTGFYCTPSQRDRLAERVDVALITHRHHDHADYSLARRLIDRGRPIVGPLQLKQTWPALADGLTVATSMLTAGPVALRAMLGWQYATSEPRDDGQRDGVPSARPGADSESVVYLYRLGGLTCLQAAENHVPAGEFLAAAAAAGWRPDLVFSTGQYQGARSVDAFLAGLAGWRRVPLHDYELTHGGGGNRTAPWFAGDGVERGRVIPLFWGESTVVQAAS